jgi:hypothetical protein
MSSIGINFIGKLRCMSGEAEAKIGTYGLGVAEVSVIKYMSL